MVEEIKRKTKTLNWFHVLNMLKRNLFFGPLKNSFEMPLIVLVKREAFAGLQIYPKKLSHKEGALDP